MTRKTKGQIIEELSARVTQLESENDRRVEAETARLEAERALRAIEERYQTLFDNSMELIYVHDFEGNFIDANDRALDLLGFERSEIGSVNIARLLNKEDLPRAMGGILDVLRYKSTSSPQEFMLRVRNGRRVWVEVSGVRIDEDGLPSSVLGIGRDVTDRKIAETSLRESESRFRSMFNNAAEMIYVYDPSGQFLDANERTVSALGYFTTELMSMKLQDVVAEDDVPIALEDIRVILERGSLSEPSEYRVKSKDGRLLWVEVTGVRMSWGGGMSVVLGAARDITSSKLPPG